MRIYFPPFTRKEIERFLSHINIKGPDECWEWQGAKTNWGYGC